MKMCYFICLKVPANDSRMLVQHCQTSNILDQKCCICLWTMLDDVGPKFFSQKMLDESLK